MSFITFQKRKKHTDEILHSTLWILDFTLSQLHAYTIGKTISTIWKSYQIPEKSNSLEWRPDRQRRVINPISRIEWRLVNALLNLPTLPVHVNSRVRFLTYWSPRKEGVIHRVLTYSGEQKSCLCLSCSLLNLHSNLLSWIITTRKAHAIPYIMSRVYLS